MRQWLYVHRGLNGMKTESLKPVANTKTASQRGHRKLIGMGFTHQHDHGELPNLDPLGKGLKAGVRWSWIEHVSHLNDSMNISKVVADLMHLNGACWVGAYR